MPHVELDACLRYWLLAAEDLGWLAKGYIRMGMADRAYAAASMAWHYAAIKDEWERREWLNDKYTPEGRERGYSSDYENETPLGQQLMDGTDYPGDAVDFMAVVGD